MVEHPKVVRQVPLRERQTMPSSTSQVPFPMAAIPLPIQARTARSPTKLPLRLRKHKARLTIPNTLPYRAIAERQQLRGQTTNLHSSSNIRLPISASSLVARTPHSEPTFILPRLSLRPITILPARTISQAQDLHLRAVDLKP